MDQLNKIIDILGNLSTLRCVIVVLIYAPVQVPQARRRSREWGVQRFGGLRIIPPDEFLLTLLQAQDYIRSLPRREPTPFEKLFKGVDAQGTEVIPRLRTMSEIHYPLLAIELLRRMITFDPADRISVAEALKHPWLSTYHNPDDEPDCVESFQRWREVEELETVDDFKRAIWDEIQDYRREVRGLKSASGSPVATKWTSPTTSHPTVDAQVQPPATTTGLGLGQIEEETAADLKTDTTRSSNSTSPHQKEEPTTTETSPPPTEVAPSKGKSESKPVLPPPEPLPPLPQQENSRSRPISRANSGKGDRRPSNDERPSSTASITTPTDPVLTYARRSSSFQQQQHPSIPNSGRSSPVHPHLTNHHNARKPIPNFGEGGYFDEGANLKELYGHGKHLHRNTVAFPSGDSYVVPARSRTTSVFGPYPHPPAVPFPSSTHGGDGVSGFPGTGNYSHTIGPGVVGSRLLRTLSTVSIHESGQGLKGGLADIAPIGKFITERGSDDELLASEVPEEFKEGGFKDAEGFIDKKKGRKRKGANKFTLK